MSPDESLNKISLPSAPIAPWRMLSISAVFAVGLIYISLGLFYRQMIQSNELMLQSKSQGEIIVWRQPMRGKILDRNGVLLVDNRIRWSVKADLLLLEDEIDHEYKAVVKTEKANNSGNKINYEELHQIARRNVLNRWLKKIWFVIDATNQKKSPNDKVQKKFLANNSEREVSLDALNRHMRDSRAIKFTLISDLTFPEYRSLFQDEEASRSIARFVEQFPTEGPITIESDMIRAYPFGSLAAHTLGYIKDNTEIPSEYGTKGDFLFKDLTKSKFTGKLGAEGVEKTFNQFLTGNCGWERWSKTSAGYKRELLESYPAKQGAEIRLSLDVNIQSAAEKAMSQIREPSGDLLPGAAVMLDANTGEILALVSQPNYDPNLLANRVTNKYYNKIQEEGGWLNRATQGLYAPGSTFKIITAIAGMRNRRIDYDDILNCGPSLRVGNRDFLEHEPQGFGQVDLEKMLAISCNVWNYKVGLMVGPDLLAAEARRFGLDMPLLDDKSDLNSTELPSPARRMIIPDPAYKLRINQPRWTDGDTANTSIGQGYILTSPLHMACLAASLARGETITIPTIKFDPSRPSQVLNSPPIGLNRRQSAALREGMVRCVEEGTARVMKIPGLMIAAKTGTAEYFTGGQKAHLAWVIGYAPANNPKVAFAVLVEGQVDTNTWGGATAGPVAQAMLKAWMKIKDETTEE